MKIVKIILTVLAGVIIGLAIGTMFVSRFMVKENDSLDVQRAVKSGGLELISSQQGSL